MAYEQNFFITQGSDWSANVVHYKSNTSGRFVVDMSAYANGAGQLRKCVSSNTSANLVVSVHTGNTQGTVFLFMNNATTSSIEEGRHLYDVEVTTPTGQVDIVVRGTFTVHPGITRT